MMAARRARRLLLYATGLCAVALACALVTLRRFRLPTPTGPYAVGTCILNLTDSSRHEANDPNPAARRELVVQLWYPAASNAQQPFARYQRWRETTLTSAYTSLLPTHSHLDAPLAAGSFTVLLYAPRWNGERTQNTALAEDLASHGYIVAAVDHPYQASRVQLASGKVVKGTEPLEGPGGPAAPAEQQIAFWNSHLDLWATDARLVLDQLATRNADPVDPLYGHVRTDISGAFGHSFGGAASLRLCGLDPRIKAAINLDGWTFGGLRNRTAAQEVMITYDGAYANRRQQVANAVPPGTVQDQIDRADYVAVDESLRRFGGSTSIIAGSQHMDFTDQPLLKWRESSTDGIAPQRMQDMLRTTILRVFDGALRGTTVRFEPE